MSKLTMASSGYQMSDQSLCEVVPTSGLPIMPVSRKKIHCILPSSPWLADSKTNIPLGVLYIAGLLREAGHEVVVTSMLDKRYEGNIALPDDVMDADVHMFGFCTPQFGEALELAAYIKDHHPDALLVAGGPHPSYEPREVKEAGRQDAYHVKGVLPQRRDYRAQDGRQLFDTVIVMEGEVATLQMLSDWHQGKLQPFYYGDKADAMDLDAIPFPAWDLLPDDHIYNDGVAVMKKRYFESTVKPGTWPVMSMIGTRGCPYKCTYCFVFNTLVDMADGSRVPIQDLRLGDLVLAFDRSTGYTRAQCVSAVGSREADDVYEMILEDGTVLGVTGDHPFVTPEGWKRAKDCEGSYLRRMRSTAFEPKSRRVDSEDVFGCVRDGSDSAGATRSGVYARTKGTLSGSRAERPREASSSSEGSASRSSLDESSVDGRTSCRAQEAVCNIPTYPRDTKEAKRDAQTWLRGRSTDNSTEASREALRVGVASLSQAEETAQARYTTTACQLGAHEVEQPNATTRSGSKDGRFSQTGVSRRSDEPAVSRSFQRAGDGIVRLLREIWFTSRSLWWQRILDWSLSVWQATQSGYEAFGFRASSDPLFVPALAYAGRYGDTVSRLSEQGLGRTQLLGGRFEDEREQEFGVCPGGRISGDWIRVESVTFVGRGTVYPISVTNDETFFAYGVATHNCSTPWIGTKPRYRSPQNIIGEMKKAFDLGIHQIKWQDDTYTLHKTKLRELASAIHSEFGDTTFASRIHTRVNTLDDHVAESLKMMSCKVTCFGIESGSQKVLDANQKGTRVEQNTAALKKAKEHGFYTIAFLVAGMAGETLETARETMAWLKSVKPYLDSCNLAVGIPYPGSRWWTHPQESGIEIVDYNYDNTWIVGFSARDEILVRPHGATVEEMFQIKNEMFQFLVAEGWVKQEWQEDVRIQHQQDEAVAAGTLPSVAVSALTYAGH